MSNTNSSLSMSKGNKGYIDLFTELGYEPLPPKPKDGDMLSVDDQFKIADLYFKQPNIMFSHHHNSFDKFLDEDVENFLTKGDNVFFENVTKNKIYRYKFVFSDVSIKPPTMDNEEEFMFPSDARKSNLTYAVKIVATTTQVQEIIDIKTDEKIERVIGHPEYEVPIATIPVMVQSKHCSLNIKKGYDYSECSFDPGGYFIVNGSEKVVMSMERMVENKPLVFKKKDANMINYSVQINSKSYTSNGMIQIIVIRMKKDGNIMIKVPILNEVPVFMVMRALGIESAKDIIGYIVNDIDNPDNNDMINLVRIALDKCTPDGQKDKQILSREDAISYLVSRLRVIKKYTDTDEEVKKQQKRMHLLSLLENNFMPHMEGGMKKKGIFLAYMIRKLLLVVLGQAEADDRDSFLNKRIDLPGTLIEELFKQNYKKMLNECHNFFRKRNVDDKTPINIINHIKPNIIEQGLKSSLLTGSWGKRKGVAQRLDRLTYLYMFSSLRRVNAPMGDAATSKLTGPRHLHGSGLPALCVTGDTQILQSDGTNKSIKDMNNSDSIMTLSFPKGKCAIDADKYFVRNKLKLEDSNIKNYFTRVPEKLFKIVTITGRSVKATPEHPFLVFDNIEFKYKRTDELTINDKIIFMNHENNSGERAVDVEYNKYILFNNNLENYLTFDEFNKIVTINDDYLSVPIYSIAEIEPEPVYDFTTLSNNHNFFANGFVTHNCFIETPEGIKVGMVKNLSILGNITVMMTSQIYIIKGFLKDKLIDIRDVQPYELSQMTKVFLNGEWLGVTDMPVTVYNDLKQMKLNRRLEPTTSIVNNAAEKEIKIFCDGGRLFRPVFRVENNKLLITKKDIDDISISEPAPPTKITRWSELLTKKPGLIEFLDTDENHQAMIAMYPSDVETMRQRMHDSAKIVEKMDEVDLKKMINRYDNTVFVNYTHCEFHPALLIGGVSSNIPFCNHNQGPRNIYQYSQARQAMGIYASNYRDRLDIAYILYHPQRPLVNTRTIKYINTDKLAAGENAIVAIACYTGLNVAQVE